MGRAHTNRRRGPGKGASVQKMGTITRPGNAVQRKAGTERPDRSTKNPQNIADPVARVIKTRA